MRKCRYDLAFSLGQACGCSGALRRAGLQFLSFPGDWTVRDCGVSASSVRDDDLCVRTDVLCDGCAEFFNAADFVRQGTVSVTGRDVYVNRRTSYVFNHDFPAGCDFAAELPKVAAKYTRRRDRLFGLIGRSSRVLAVTMDIPDGRHSTSSEACRYARRRLNERFAPARIDILHVSYVPGVPFGQRRFEEIEEGVFRLSFDFRDTRASVLPGKPRLSLVAAALAERFSVRDYRTKEEKRAYHERKWFLRCQDAGVPDRWAYLRMQVCAFVSRCNLVLDLLARIRRKRFEQIVILGFNCEAAFRFVCKWDFLDSSLFAWASTLGLEHLVRALDGLDGIGRGEMTLHRPSRMWRCENCQVFFHGRMRARPDTPDPTPEECAADLSDLRARLAHLKEKFLTYARNGRQTLYVYKLTSEEARRPGLDAKLAALETALRNLGARNLHLLVVCERQLLDRMPAGPNRTFRAVSRYNPVDKVTSRKKGDPAGWRRIFSEFAPMRILRRAHGFKYE